MKGVILAGGRGIRLAPCTLITNKHLLPVYNKPMIFYPLQTLVNAGIKDILIVSESKYIRHFVKLIGYGKKFGVNIQYETRDEARGIAHALSLAESFAHGDNLAVILGDNIFEDDFKEAVSNFSRGATIFLKESSNPQQFGVAKIEDGRVVEIEEKPTNPKTNKIVTGFYIYDHDIFEVIKQIRPSKRGELEITDVNNIYAKNYKLNAHILTKFWIDAGTFDSLLIAANFIKNKSTSH